MINFKNQLIFKTLITKNAINFTNNYNLIFFLAHYLKIISQLRKPKSKRVGKTVKPYIMKKGILFLIGLFVTTISTTAVNTSTIENFNRNRTINFVENGVAFTVYTNGEFNFDTDVFINRNGRNFRQQVFIDRDFRGRINFINNIPIRYNRWNNVTRIGDVIIRYNRGRIVNVGHMNISYNQFGNPIFFGNVRNNFNINVNLGRIYSYNDIFFNRRDFRRNYTQFRRDRNYIYYRNKANNVVRRSVANNARNNNILKNRTNKGNKINRNNTVRKNNRNTVVTKRKTVVTRSNNGNRNNTRRSTSTERRSR